MNRNQTPARLRHTVALAVGLGCSSAAISIGLGPIHVNSSIGQPMSATIPVEGLTAASAKGATVQLASAAAYRARGIELLPSHQKLRFSLVPSGKGYVIRVTSTASIREPFVNFLITINSNGSTVTREYAAFFNPDPLNPNAAEPMAVVEKPTLADSDSKSKKKGKKDKAEKAERELLPVGEPESRAELAGTRRSEPVLANPKKEKEQKEKAKKDKAKEQQIAARKAQAPLRAASADSEGWGGHDLALQQKQARPAPAARNDNGEDGYSYYSASVKPGSIPVGSKYGPVKSNETLFSIANAARPSDSVSIQQMMRAIYNANRGSFAHNDMGNLMIGSTLVIPDPSAAALPAGKAVPAEVADNSAKAKAEAKKAEKAAKAAAKAAAAAATEIAAAQNDVADVKADESAQKEADNKAAATPAIEVAQNDTPAPEAASGSAENAPLDGNALTLDGADSLAANKAQPAAEAAPVDLSADNAPQVAANDAQAEQPAEIAAVQPEPIPAEQPAEVDAPVAVEVAANDAAPTAPAVVPEMKTETVAAVAQEKPEDKVSSGLPLPLLAAAGTGVLALGGAAAFMLAKRKRRDDEDNMEEFSQDAIDRLAAEMDAGESQKIGDKVGEVKVRNAAPASADLDGLDRLNAQLSELDDLNNKFSGLPKYRDEYDDGEPHSADELPDDFFKDLEIPDDEPASPVAAVAGVDLHKDEPAAIAAPPASDEADEDYDFFSDLEKLAAEDDAPAEPAAAPLANGAASHDEFDDFLSLEKDSAAAEKTEPKLAAVAHADEAEAADEFDDFLSFASEETATAPVAKPSETAAPAAETDEFDDFLSFASEEAPAAKAEAQPAAHADKTVAEPADNFDFLSFAAEESAAPAEPVKAEPAPTADEGDDFDFISFASDDAATPAKAEPAPAPTAEDDGLDFFASDDEAEKAAPHHTVVSDAVVIAAEPVAAKAEDEALDFFALEDEPVRAPEAVVPVAAVADDDETLDFFNSDAAQDVVVEAAETVKTAAAPQHIDQLAAAEPAPKATVTVTKPVIAPAASDADVDVEAMEINLDMATSFIVMGKAEKARSWLDEVLESGSEAQKVRARSMLEQLEKA